MTGAPHSIKAPPHLRAARRVTATGLERVQTRIAKSYLHRAGLGSASQIATFTTPQELRWLLTLALELPANSTILEIGSYVGASTAYLMAGVFGRGGRVVCIDTWQNETMPDGIRDTFAEFHANLAPARTHITTIRKPTKEVTFNDLPRVADLIFIDGDHSYEAVHHDFNLIRPLVHENTTVAFHDVAHFGGPSRVLGECLASGQWRLFGLAGNLAWIRPTVWEK